MEEKETPDPIVDKLFEKAMRGDWEDVVVAYAKFSGEIIKRYEAAPVKGDSALHVAVADNQTQYVSKIIEGIPSSEHLMEILKMRNRKGNTPLHLAAAIGKIDICAALAVHDNILFKEKNDAGETPLFLAAKRGHEKAFFYLQYRYGENDTSLLINKNRDTILHSAIYGQNYGFAMRIMEHYCGCFSLVDKANDQGLTPLHALALQPLSFKSSTTRCLGLFDLIFYTCIFIGEHRSKDEQKDFEEIKRDRSSERRCIWPHNYDTCCSLYDMLKHIVSIIGSGNIADDRSYNEANIEGQRGLGSTSDDAYHRTKLTDIVVVDGENRLRRKKELEKKRPSTTICHIILQIFKFIAFVPLHFLGGRIKLIVETKRKHKLAKRLLVKLLDRASVYNPEGKVATLVSSTSDQCRSTKSTGVCMFVSKLHTAQKEQHRESSEPHVRRETPLLTAAKLGIYEMVDAILDKFPEAIEDEDFQEKNAVLLAAENRQTRVYRLLLENKRMVHESVFTKVDADGNSALHLAARYNPNRPWFTPGPALQLKWEIKWHQYVKDSMPSNCFALRNNERKTANEIFRESHTVLSKDGQEWLSKTCTAYSVIATLIATVAFATSASIPGSYNDEGRPALDNEFAFSVFSISSLIALCTSMSAAVFFIALLATRYEQEDFAETLPNRLRYGLSFLFTSVASILVSFSSGVYFSVRNNLKNAAYPIFGVMCLPVTIFAISQVHLYIGLLGVFDYQLSKKRRYYDHDIEAH